VPKPATGNTALLTGFNLALLIKFDSKKDLR